MNKYKNLPLPVKATIWFTVCNFALKGISFICMPLYTRILPAEEYGKMSVFTSYESIFIIFATFEVYLGAYQRGILKYKKEIKEFENSIVAFSNILTTVCLAIVCLFNKPFYEFTGISLELYFLMTAYFLVIAPYNCWLNKKRFDYDYKAAVSVTLLMAVLANMLPLLTTKVFGRTAYVKVGSTLIISSLFCFPFWIRDFNPLSIIKNKNRFIEYTKYALCFQGPLVFHSLSYYVLNQSDRIMIDKFSDSTKVAFYSAAYSLASVITLFQNSLNQVMRPWRYKKLESKHYSDILQTSNSIVALVGMGIMAFMLIVPEVFMFLFPANYHESLRCMPPITMGVYFLFLYTIFVDVESYYGKTQYIAYVSTSCALLNIILNYFGMLFFDYTICAYTTLICYIVMAYLHYISMKRTCKKAKVTQRLIDGKFIWTFSSILLCAFLVINMIYESIVLRYSVLACVLLVMFIKRMEIITIINQVKNKKKEG